MQSSYEGELQSCHIALRLGGELSSIGDLAVADEIKAQGKAVLEVLQIWQASTAIVQQQRLQTLIAALHCSYP